MNKAPTSVLVLGIIGIILGCFGILGVIWSLTVLFVSFGPPNPLLDSLRHDTTYLAVTGISLAISVPVTILSIIASIGSLKLRPWARKAMLLCAWISIVQLNLGVLFYVIYVVPKMLAAMPPGAPAVVRGALIGGIVGGACGSILGVIFPICVVYFFNRPLVKDAFNGLFPPVFGNFPVDYADAPLTTPPDAPKQYP